VRILLDTNRLTDALRGDRDAVEIVEQAAEVWIPFVALAEIRAGFRLGTRAHQNERLMTAFLQQPGIEPLYADSGTTEVYARLFAQLRRAGTPIPTNDLWIASLAVQHQLILVSRADHFAEIPQVARM
jgi:tRNA(fMet)-specific endonuclease VapC